MNEDLNALTLRNIFKLQLYKFLISLLKGNIPSFYNLLLSPFLTLHSYHTRGRIFRHPLITCEVDRRAVATQMILMLENIPIEEYNYFSVCKSCNNEK